MKCSDSMSISKKQLLGTPFKEDIPLINPNSIGATLPETHIAPESLFFFLKMSFLVV